jgi:hypothetical protein
MASSFLAISPGDLVPSQCGNGNLGVHRSQNSSEGINVVSEKDKQGQVKFDD